MNVDPEYDRLLRSRGASDEEILAAAERGQHYLNALNTELTLTPRGDLDAEGLAAAAGLTLDELVDVWHTMGFADPRLAGRTLSQFDLVIAQTAAALGAFLPDAAGRDLLRVFASATRQVANAGVNSMRVGFEQPLRKAGTSDAGVSQAYDAVLAVLPGVTEAFDALMRRFIVESVYEQVAVNQDGSVQTMQTIVFADLVDYTGLAQRLSPAELARTLSAFEAAAADTAAIHHGRLVKLLGDGVMLSFPVRADGIAAAVALVSHADIAPCRAGVATGPVLTRQGDFYGSVVNLAARLSGVVGASEVAVDDTAALVDSELAAPVALKGIDEPVAYYRLG